MALALLAASGGPARAAVSGSAATASFWFAGTRLLFERPRVRAGALAVAGDDAGLARFLAKLGATVADAANRNAAVVTTADRRTVVFTLGDARFVADGIARTAAFAPYASGGEIYLPFLDLARALRVAAVDDGATTVLQPQIATLDVRTDDRITTVTLRGASALRFRRLTHPGEDRLSLVFPGVASPLERRRSIASASLRAVSVTPGGTPRNPMTIVDFDMPAGTAHALVAADGANALAIAFGPPGVALGGSPVPADGVATGPAAVALAPPPVSAAPALAPPTGEPPAQPSPASPPAPASAPTPTAQGLPAARLTGFSTDESGDGLRVHLALAGNVTYEWHRLPDDRWYVDLKPAILAMPAQEVALHGPAASGIRIKGFVGPTDRLATVRVALTLASPRAVTLAPEDAGLSLAVDALDDTSAQRVGSGEVADGRLVATIVPPPTPAPTPDAAAAGAGDETPNPEPTWKFAPPPPAGTNARLIVIDPGHGGSDAGAMHNGLVEKDLNLDVAKRLRGVLVARGWQVRLTRERDVDVFAPNDSARDELQARDDVANAAGARLLVSVHTNSFTTSALNGTTTYYFNADSYALANAVHARLAAALPTRDDGVRKENFYVIHHTKMPAILVETAFLSNPGDAELLKSSAFLQKVASAIADGVGDFTGASAPLSSTMSSGDGQ